MTDALLEVASSQLSRGKAEEALRTLARVDGAALETPAPWVIRAAALAESNRLPEALRVATEALSRWPEHILLRRLAAAFAWRTHDSALAERHYLAALRLRPDDAGLLCGYAEVVAAAAQMDKAVALVERAAQFDPDHDAVHRARWVLANLRGDDAEAHRLAAVRVARDPSDAGALAALASESLYAGDTGRAHRIFGAAVAADVDTARSSDLELPLRIATHWALVPLAPVRRFGAVPVTIAGLVAVNVLRRVAPEPVVLPLVLTWLAYCVYTWVVPPLVRWHVARSLR